MSIQKAEYSLSNFAVQERGKQILEIWKDTNHNELVDQPELKAAYDTFNKSQDKATLSAYSSMENMLSHGTTGIAKRDLVNSLYKNFLLDFSDLDVALIVFENNLIYGRNPSDSDIEILRKTLIKPFLESASNISLSNKKVVLLNSQNGQLSPRDSLTLQKIKDVISRFPGLQKTLDDMKDTVYMALSERGHTSPRDGYSMSAGKGEQFIMLTNNPLNSLEGVILNEFNEAYDKEKFLRQASGDKDQLAFLKYDAISTTLDIYHLSKLNTNASNYNLKDLLSGFNRSVKSGANWYIEKGTSHKLSDIQKKEIKDSLIARIQRYTNADYENIAKEINFDGIFTMVDSLSDVKK